MDLHSKTRYFMSSFFFKLDLIKYTSNSEGYIDEYTLKLIFYYMIFLSSLKHKLSYCNILNVNIRTYTTDVSSVCIVNSRLFYHYFTPPQHPYKLTLFYNSIFLLKYRLMFVLMLNITFFPILLSFFLFNF